MKLAAAAFENALEYLPEMTGVLHAETRTGTITIVLFDPALAPNFPRTVWRRLPISPDDCSDLRNIVFIPQRRCQLDGAQHSSSTKNIGFISCPTESEVTRLVVASGAVAPRDQQLHLAGANLSATLLEVAPPVAGSNLAVLQAQISEDSLCAEWRQASLFDPMEVTADQVLWQGRDTGAAWRQFLHTASADILQIERHRILRRVHSLVHSDLQLESVLYMTGRMRIDGTIVENCLLQLMDDERWTPGDCGRPLMALTATGMQVLGFHRGTLSTGVGFGKDHRGKQWRFGLFMPAWHKTLWGIPAAGLVHISNMPH